MSSSPVPGGHDIFFAAVQMTRMPMCLSDPTTPDNPLIFVNQAFEELTGYEKDEILGRNCRFLQGPETDRDTVAEVARAITARQDVSAELVNYRKDGSKFWNALYISPVYDQAGSLTYFFASQIDQTRRRAAEEVLQQSLRMEALGSMAIGVAHEFNNLMTVVGGSLEQARGLATSERQIGQLDRAASSAARAGRLTDQLLGFSRRQDHEEKPADLNELVRGLDTLLAPLFGGDKAVIYDLDHQALPISVDAGHFELAMIALARHVANAGSSEGAMTIRTQGLDAHDGRRSAVLVVSDVGFGRAEDLKRDFAEPFFANNAEDGEPRLGLSIVRHFAERSRAEVAIETAAIGETRITLTLPCLAG